MPSDRPPVTDAEFRVVRGPWPRWAMHLSLIKLALYSAAISAVCVLVALALIFGFGLLDDPAGGR